MICNNDFSVIKYTVINIVGGNIMFSLKVLDAAGKTVAVVRGEEEINLVLTREYREGDVIYLQTSETPVFIWLQLDETMGKSLVYLNGELQYPVPFAEERLNLSPKAFSGEKHLLWVRKAKDFEIKTYRNLAANVNDRHGNIVCYPHASANVETRGEAVFVAKNAIDGVTANACHGEWPYGSWGINQNPDARLKLDFGREVEIDRIIIYLRADFPHDNWWEKITVYFSDGENKELSLRKTENGQEFLFEKKKISWLDVGNLIQSKEPSPFPALTQIEVYGTDIIE